MVDRTLISQLQSMNVSQRKEAIMALARTKEREVISHLSRVAETDPDEELRELARKAALYIDKNAPVVNVKPFKLPWDDEEGADEQDEGPSPMSAAAALRDYEEPSADEVTERQDREWADRFIERAWQAHYLKDREGAELFLRKAFERAPKIAEQESARDAASKIMGMNPDRAVAALLKPKTMRRGAKPDSISKRPSTLTAKPVQAPTPKAEKTVDEIEDGSMGTLLFDLFVFFLIVFALNFIGLMLVSQLLGDSLLDTAFSNDPTGLAARDFVLSAIGGGTVGIALSAAGSALVTVLETLFLWFVIHMVASTLLNGNSTFPRLVRKTYLFYALATPVLVTLFIVSVFLAAALKQPQLLQTLLIVTSISSLFVFAWRIGVAYRFDIGRGCLTMVLTTFALVCCSVTITIALAVAGSGPLANTFAR